MTRRTVLNTARLTLTTWELDDLPDLFSLHANPLTMKFIGAGAEDEEAARRRLTGYLNDQEVRGWTKWRVQDAEGHTVGRAGFGLMEDRRHRELGYLLKPELWGTGLATELAQALVRWHFEHPDPDLSSELFAYAATQNTASLRVLEKVGFQRTEEKYHAGRQHTFYVLRGLDP